MRLLVIVFTMFSLIAIADSIDEIVDNAPALFLEQAVVGPQGDGTDVVATQQFIDPAGDTVIFPGRPVDLALSPDGATLVVKNKNDLVFFELSSRTLSQTLPMPSEGTSYHGIQWSQDGAGVWVTDSKKTLWLAERREDGKFDWKKVGDAFVGAYELPAFDSKDSVPGGFVVNVEEGVIYVCISRNNSIGIVDVASKAVLEEIPVGISPYAIVRQGQKAYVTNWGGRRPREDDLTGPTSGSRVVVDAGTGVANSGTVSVIDLATKQVVREIEVDLHPTEMAFSPDGKRLYVANANSDTVSVINTRNNELVDTISTRPMADMPFGSAPNALAVSSNGKTLYVANGGNNCIAVINIRKKKVIGLIPTGWYPGAVELADDGKLLIVANTKGVGGREHEYQLAHGITPKREAHNSHGHLGSVSFIPVPDEAELAAMTTRAATNMRLPMLAAAMKIEPVEPRITPVPTGPGETSPIKHVLYIIKENRTYDQVFGDVPEGNGDPSLCHFGVDVTPNHHALAKEFVLFDNFYCNGVLSADGHQWTNEGYVTDYIEKNFGGFNRSYPYAGDDALAYASSGFIWDLVLKKGLSLRVYGEFVQAKIEPSNATWTQVYEDYLNGTRHVSITASTQLHTLEPHLSPNFIGFPSLMQDVYRAQVFTDELAEFEKNGDLPNFMIMLLPNDHTVGTRPKFPTPRAMVADNDLAVGRIVEALSHSRFWPETAIFVVQDDPQAGVDHVDGRRTVAMLISPYTRRGMVDSTFYNQNSMLRTMELMLGLPPMNQLDLAAAPMLSCFQEEADLTPYTARENIIPLDEMNPEVAQLTGKQKYWAQKSLELPISDVDLADEYTFNRILWHAVKGYDTPYPDLARRKEVDHTAWPTADAEMEDED